MSSYNIPMNNLIEKTKSLLFSKWIACSIISDKKSVQYGIKFSYPVYILIVIAGVSLEDRLILFIAALIAILAIKLPLHPFDYLYNYGVAKLFRLNEIPGRGSELQVNSIVALIFNSVVFALITFGAAINYSALAAVYTLITLFFICTFLLKK